MSKKLEPNFYHLLNNIDCIVCIGRGGLLPSLLLSQKLNIKDVQITNISSYKEKVAEGIVLHNNTKLDIKDKNVLIVDDLTDSGKTLDYAVSLCKDAKNVETFVVYYKSCSSFEPDFYFKKMDSEKWIEFNYEKNTCFSEWFD
jgi:hypoxanthine phosphoribosyltransferase